MRINNGERIMAKWKKVLDKVIRHFWICKDEDCPDGNSTAVVGPDWYEQNGTPVCTACDRDMEYDYTEIQHP
jgi:hypothetical protein